MTQRRGYLIVLPLMVLILTGCFRQASEPFDALEEEPVSNTAVPGVQDSPTPMIAVTESTSVIPPTEIPAGLDTEIPVEPVDTQTDPNSPIPMESPTITTIPTRITPLPPAGTSAITSPTPDSAGVTNTPSDLVTPTVAPDEVVDECTYIVQPGDNLFRISVNSNVSLDELRSANPQVTGDIIQPGDRLVIPGCTPDAVAPVDSGSSGQVPITSSGTVHIVQAGETLSIIARNYGVTITSIVQANGLENPNRLAVGQELIIPN